MRVTLHLSPGNAKKLLQLPVVKTARAGRARSQAVRIVWHDTLDRHLTSRGLALAEERGVWRLTREQPDPAELCPPGSHPRLLGEGPRPEDIQHVPADPMAPMAAFDGRRTQAALVIDGGTVELTLLDGVLRTVAAEKPAARLTLDGPDAAVGALALALCEPSGLSPPEHGLATQAVCLADGSVPSPRRLGAPALESTNSARALSCSMI